MKRAIAVAVLAVLAAAAWVSVAGGQVLDRSRGSNSTEAAVRVTKPKMLRYEVVALPAEVRVRVILDCTPGGPRPGDYGKSFNAPSPVRRRPPVRKEYELCVFRVFARETIPEDIPVEISVTLAGKGERKMTIDRPSPAEA